MQESRLINGHVFVQFFRFVKTMTSQDVHRCCHDGLGGHGNLKGSSTLRMPLLPRMFTKAAIMSSEVMAFSKSKNLCKLKVDHNRQ